MSDKQTIVLQGGLGSLGFGATEAQVREYLGEPDVVWERPRIGRIDRHRDPMVEWLYDDPIIEWRYRDPLIQAHLSTAEPSSGGSRSLVTLGSMDAGTKLEGHVLIDQPPLAVEATLRGLGLEIVDGMDMRHGDEIWFFPRNLRLYCDRREEQVRRVEWGP